MAKFSTQRARLTRLIHIAKSDLRMDEETYRQILRDEFRADSSKELSIANLERLQEHMKACGFKVRPAKAAGTTRKLDNEPQSKMIRGIWLELHQAGVVRNSSEPALNAFIKRMTGIETLDWLTGLQASKVIEELKKWRDRVSQKGGNHAADAR